MRVTVEESHEGKMIGGQIIRSEKRGEITANSVQAQERERERERERKEALIIKSTLLLSLMLNECKCCL